jgi:hypothetical protein
LAQELKKPRCRLLVKFNVSDLVDDQLETASSN